MSRFVERLEHLMAVRLERTLKAQWARIPDHERKELHDMHMADLADFVFGLWSGTEAEVIDE